MNNLPGDVLLLIAVDLLRMPFPKALKLRRVCRRWKQILDAQFQRFFPAPEQERDWPVGWRIHYFISRLNQDQVWLWLARQKQDYGRVAALTIEIQRALWPTGYKIQ